ncbi:hypothetical protein N7533_000041 [Penicillium manginii]|jgi:hypothetical protein|uniref:uncharacterized protein n=1 Tax=Penicillium manginii TaxID=203109 RepID=UPI002546C5D6|nr:uncharacterized protein N7533_000041 [Penicillium manginii]KAJ5767458.1 hypothetical protein N7533_000041 [Penicillium manginii]
MANKISPEVWLVFLTPEIYANEKHLKSFASLPYDEERKTCFQYTYIAWLETPGALDFIIAKVQKKDERVKST